MYKDCLKVFYCINMASLQEIEINVNTDSLIILKYSFSSPPTPPHTYIRSYTYFHSKNGQRANSRHPSSPSRPYLSQIIPLLAASFPNRSLNPISIGLQSEVFLLNDIQGLFILYSSSFLNLSLRKNHLANLLRSWSLDPSPYSILAASPDCDVDGPGTALEQQISYPTCYPSKFHPHTPLKLKLPLLYAPAILTLPCFAHAFPFVDRKSVV